MKYVPLSVSRGAARGLLKFKAKSPTILVVSGVIGLGATAVMAAKATRKIDPVVEGYQKARWAIKEDAKIATITSREESRELLNLYVRTGVAFSKIYGPSLFVGTASAISVLGGHKILVGRHIASMAAYSGLFNEFADYRSRVAETFGEDKEMALYKGGKLAYVEDPNHKGEFTLEPDYSEANTESYLRPWFDQSNPNWVNDPETNFLFLKGVQTYMNNVLNTRGFVMLNDVADALRLQRTSEGQVAGWFRDDNIGDGFVDFGLYDNDPVTIAFRKFERNTAQLHFNIDGNVYEKINKMAR